jgi:geranylgeranyl diphosphate synthase type II
MVLLAAQACGGELEAAIPAACAIEMVHAYSLVHDDLPAMDDDDLRRGRPTCHKKFGEATAILVGDALLARAFEILAHDVQPADVAARCVAALGEASGATALVGGQADDLASAQHPGGSEAAGALDQRLEDLERIHLRKTGAMFLVSLRLGGLTAGAGDAELAALDDYGKHIGLAFQITDDLLDVHGDEQFVGKRLRKDGRQGKMTYPSVLGASESRRRAAELIGKAKGALDRFGPAGKPLAELADMILNRKA